jgi:hypothetical protein
VAGLFAFGLLCAVSVARTGAVWWAAGFHAVWDFVQVWVLGLPSYGDSGAPALVRLSPTGADPWLSGGSFGPEASPLAIGLLALATVAWAFWRPEAGRKTNRG